MALASLRHVAGSKGFSVDLGTLPQWLSGGVAVLLLAGAIWILCKHGHRATISISARVCDSILTTTVHLKCDGRWQVRPFRPLPCPHALEHGCLTPEDIEKAKRKPLHEQAWPATVRDPMFHESHASVVPRRRPRVWVSSPRFANLTVRGRRQKVWLCPNQKVPAVRVYEARRTAGPEVAADDWSESLSESLLFVRKSALFGHNLEYEETLTFDHAFMVDSDPDVLAWRATVEVWIKKWNWFLHPVDADSWLFQSTVIIPNRNGSS